MHGTVNVKIILPVVLYGFETRSFTLIEELQFEGVSEQGLKYSTPKLSEEVIERSTILR
jgi:hypothetical protein